MAAGAGAEPTTDTGMVQKKKSSGGCTIARAGTGADSFGGLLALAALALTITTTRRRRGRTR